MSTTPTITAAVQSEVSTLAHRHVTFTYGLVVVIILMMALMGVGGYLGLKAFDAQLARQDAKDAQYQQDRKAFTDTLTSHDAERAAQASQIAQLQSQISHRDTQSLPKPITDGLKPDATSQQVAGAITVAYSNVPSFGAVVAESPTTIALSLPQAQQVAKDKIGLDTARADLNDEKSTVSLLNTANASLNGDLSQCKVLNTKAEADIQGYKRLAVRSRWQKFLGGVEKVALVAVGFELGHKI